MTLFPPVSTECTRIQINNHWLDDGFFWVIFQHVFYTLTKFSDAFCRWRCHCCYRCGFFQQSLLLAQLITSKFPQFGRCQLFAYISLCRTRVSALSSCVCMSIYGSKSRRVAGSTDASSCKVLPINGNVKRNEELFHIFTISIVYFNIVYSFSFHIHIHKCLAFTILNYIWLTVLKSLYEILVDYLYGCYCCCCEKFPIHLLA